MGWRQRNHPAIEGSTRPTPGHGKMGKSREETLCVDLDLLFGSAPLSTCIILFGADAGRKHRSSAYDTSRERDPIMRKVMAV